MSDLTSSIETVKGSYSYVCFDESCMYDEEYDNENQAVKYLINEFKYHTKGIVFKDIAYDYWGFNLSVQKIKMTIADLQRAYDIAFGYGCEYEWGK